MSVIKINVSKSLRFVAVMQCLNCCSSCYFTFLLWLWAFDTAFKVGNIAAWLYMKDLQFHKTQSLSSGLNYVALMCPMFLLFFAIFGVVWFRIRIPRSLGSLYIKRNNNTYSTLITYMYSTQQLFDSDAPLLLLLLLYYYYYIIIIVITIIIII